MTVSTTTPGDKREKLKKLREHHQPVLDYLGTPDAVLLGKLAYHPAAGESLHISFFESEISKANDVFVEFTNRDLDPEDANRTLYKYRFNPDFKTAYRTTEPSGQTGHVRYLVPVTELVKIDHKIVAKTQAATQQEFNLIDPDHDCELGKATLRDVAAIFLRIPMSQKQWLNEMIINSKIQPK